MATIMNENERFHLKIKTGDVGRYVILPGDPGRVPKIAALLDNAEQIAQNREYNIYTGYLTAKKSAYAQQVSADRRRLSRLRNLSTAVRIRSFVSEQAAALTFRLSAVI